MKNFRILLIFLSFACLGARAQQSVSINVVTNHPHPRILLLGDEPSQIEQSIAHSQVWMKMHQAILSESNRIIDLPPVERIQIGRRLLDKSREALRRIFQLSYAWRMTGEQKYFDRCEKEMLAISNFSDWNPSHFLDVAEMTMAVSIGYDWLYPKLSEKSKQIIRQAIIEKGLNQSFDSKYNSWLKVVNNWNQVCNAGMTYGALAVADEQPELAKKVIDRALNSIHLPMDEYKPDGAYPEGYGYWGYGTSFNVMFLSAIEKIFGTDFSLSETPGFLSTPGFLQNMTGVTGQCYNWGDSGLGGSLSPAMFWFAQRNNDPSQLWVEKSYLQRDDYSVFTHDRLLPAVMIWGKGTVLEKIAEPKAKAWKGQGANPVAMMRTSWTDPNAIYLGFKTGSPSVNHAHMDVGSFIMEANGVRWASDFGSQDYESLESKGIALWGREQNAQRWTIFRLNNKAHNTLTINDQLQNVKGYAQIERFSDEPDFMFATTDLSSIYAGELKSEQRGVAIVNQKYVVISDELQAENKPTTVRWTMMTTATPELKEKTIVLTKNGKKLFVKINSNAPVTLKTWSTTPTTTYDAQNPGTTLVGFELNLKANEKKSIQVLLIPETANEKDTGFNRKLADWR
jgi:Heparinase II/III-like protein.